jgi:hypothetical protein
VTGDQAAGERLGVDSKPNPEAAAGQEITILFPDCATLSVGLGGGGRLADKVRVA